MTDPRTTNIKVPVIYGGEGCMFCMGTMVGIWIADFLHNPSEPKWIDLFFIAFGVLVFLLVFFCTRSSRHDLFVALANRGVIIKQTAVHERVLWADTGKEVDEV